ncbi:tetraspanin-10-like [Arachis stenosperma]|uniref:tetraspanin-10-like n=1 Tax=Arachis stenosperma TaxID=217475 RepID=UPI0025ABCA63|nr:tetraspanin-10-like [Arachis stenosperma]
MGVGTSTFVTRWINFLTMVLAIVVIIFGVWMSMHHDGCRKSLTLPVLALGAVIFLISIVGFLGALKNNSILLWIYLILLFFVLVGILVFTVLVFIVTNDGSGHSVTGLRYKEYQLQDYSSWFLKELNNSHNWERLRVCLVKSDDCNKLSKKYKTLKEYKLAKLSPVEAGCCRPPSQCGFPAVNSSYYDLTFHPASANKDCKRYKNSGAIKCYDCDSCKAGVAQYMKIEWRVVAIFNVVLFVVLCIVYFVGCCARRNAARGHSKA